MTTPQHRTTATRVQLTLQARRLRNVAGAFKGTSDPYCIVTLLSSNPGETPRVIGKTEVVKNSLNPAWTTALQLDYEFGKLVRFNVGIYDEVRKMKKNKAMGSALFEVGEILGSKGGVKAKVLKNGGVLYARIERAPVVDSGMLHLQLQGIKLKNVDGLFSKSDPFFELSRRLDNTLGGKSWEVVYRSPHIMNDLNPKWQALTISMDRICNGDPNKPVLVSVYDWEKSGRHTPMGFFETSVNGLMTAKMEGNVKKMDASKTFELIKRGKSFGKVVVVAVSISGGGATTGYGGASTFPTQQPTVAVPPVAPYAGASTAALAPPRATSSNAAPPFSMSLDVPPPESHTSMAPPAPSYTSSNIGYNLPTATVPPPPRTLPLHSNNNTKRPNFVDYVTGGCELQMCVAIDFTGSNGDPRRPGTLHYIHPHGELNDYEKALTAVMSILARYDSDQQFPVWGFGAKYNGIIRHVFQLGPTPEARGIGDVLQRYREVFTTPITMSGPTVFTEVIALAAAQARSKQQSAQRIGQQAYTILLILTDGAVSDVTATKAAIRAASDAPLSIVIVGIGNADFGAMQFLDDFTIMEEQGRDICQFVEFRRHQHDKTSLTQATLDEIPEQLVDYFYSKGIMPLPAMSGSKMSLVSPDEYNAEEDVDLTFNFGPDGEISLANNNEGFYDDTGYGDISKYAGVAVLPPPSVPYNPAGRQPSYNPASVAGQQQTYTSAGTAYASGGTTSAGFQPYVSSSTMAHKPNRQSTSYGRPQQEVAQASVVAQPVFHVKLPPGVTSGMQIQVQNPKTRQNMILTVPPGVPPGGTFGVPY